MRQSTIPFHAPKSTSKAEKLYVIVDLQKTSGHLQYRLLNCTGLHKALLCFHLRAVRRREVSIVHATIGRADDCWLSAVVGQRPVLRL